MTWEEVTAVSTLALAAVTAWLAQSTRWLAREAGAETRANWQPVLVVDAPNDDDGTSASLVFADRRLSIDVLNVGRGPALMVTSTLSPGDDDLPAASRGHAVRDVVAPGERMSVRWRDFDPPLPDGSFGIAAWATVDGMLTYGDVGYARYETEFKIGFRVDGAVALLDQRFLGSARERMGRRDRVRYRVIRWLLATERLRKRFRVRLARRLVRSTGDRHG